MSSPTIQSYETALSTLDNSFDLLNSGLGALTDIARAGASNAKLYRVRTDTRNAAILEQLPNAAKHEAHMDVARTLYDIHKELAAGDDKFNEIFTAVSSGADIKITS